MQKNIAVASSPHLRDSHASTRRIMQDVCIALAPAGIAGIVLYGMNAAMLIAVAVITAVIAEWAFQKLTKHKDTGNNIALILSRLYSVFTESVIVNWMNLHNAPASAVICL